MPAIKFMIDITTQKHYLDDDDAPENETQNET